MYFYDISSYRHPISGLRYCYRFNTLCCRCPQTQPRGTVLVPRVHILCLSADQSGLQPIGSLKKMIRQITESLNSRRTRALRSEELKQNKGGSRGKRHGPDDDDERRNRNEQGFLFKFLRGEYVIALLTPGSTTAKREQDHHLRHLFRLA